MSNMTCTVQRVSPFNVTFEWPIFPKDAKLLRSTTTKSQNNDTTYRVTRTVQTQFRRRNDGDLVRCRVRHGIETNLTAETKRTVTVFCKLMFGHYFHQFHNYRLLLLLLLLLTPPPPLPLPLPPPPPPPPLLLRLLLLLLFLLLLLLLSPHPPANSCYSHSFPFLPSRPPLLAPISASPNQLSVNVQCV